MAGNQGIRVGPKAFAIFKKLHDRVYQLKIIGKGEAQYLFKLKTKRKKQYANAEEIEVLVAKPVTLTGFYEESQEENAILMVDGTIDNDGVLHSEGEIISNIMWLEGKLADSIFNSEKITKIELSDKFADGEINIARAFYISEFGYNEQGFNIDNVNEIPLNKLKKIIIDDNVENFSTDLNGYGLYGKGTSYTSSGLLYYCAGLNTFEINSKPEIYPLAVAFRGTIESIEIPNTVMNIFKWAFYNCYGLKTLRVPQTVLYVGNEVFKLCPVETLYLACSEHHNASSIDSWGNWFKETLKYLEIYGREISDICAEEFKDCTELVTVRLRDNVMHVGDNAFENCVKIELMTTVGTRYYQDTFKNCFARIINDENNIECEEYNSNFTEYYYKENNEYIAINIENQEDFEYFKNLYNILYLPQGIGIIRFFNLPVTEVGLNNSYADVIEIYPPTRTYEIATNSFKESLIRIVSIYWSYPNYKTTSIIKEKAFYKCKYLTNFNFITDDTVESLTIENNVFNGCENLIFIDLSAAISVDYQAFENCFNISEANFNKLVFLGYNAFKNCVSLQTVVIPQTLESASSNTYESNNAPFLNCSNINNVTYNAIDLHNANSSSSENYRSVYLFYNAGNNSSLIIDNNVISLPNYVFSHFNFISPIEFSENIKSIGGYSFEYSNIPSVIFDDGFKTGIQIRYIITLNPNNWQSNRTQTVTIQGISQLEPTYTILVEKSYYPSNYTNVRFVERTGDDFKFRCTNTNVPTSEIYFIVSLISKEYNLGNGVFNNCGNLTDVTLGASMKELTISMFENDPIEILDLKGIETIDSYCFNGCENISKITFGVQPLIDTDALNNLVNVSEININGNPWCYDWMFQPVTKYNSTISYYYKENNIYFSTTGIYSQSAIDNFGQPLYAKILNTITGFGANWNYYGNIQNAGKNVAENGGIVKLKFSGNATVDYQRFYRGSYITEIDFGTILSLTTTEKHGVESYYNGAACSLNLPKLKKVESEYIEVIPEYFFFGRYNEDGSLHGLGYSYCPLLEEAKFSAVKLIKKYAFTCCYNLKSSKLTIGTVEILSEHSFGYCTSLINLTLDNLKTASSAFCYCTNLQSVSIKKFESLYETFYYCTSLSSVTTSNNETKKIIGSETFSHCYSLPDSAFNNLKFSYTSNDRSYIYVYAFPSCTSFAEITLPNNFEINSTASDHYNGNIHYGQNSDPYAYWEYYEYDYYNIFGEESNITTLKSNNSRYFTVTGSSNCIISVQHAYINYHYHNSSTGNPSSYDRGYDARNSPGIIMGCANCTIPDDSIKYKTQKYIGLGCEYTFNELRAKYGTIYKAYWDAQQQQTVYVEVTSQSQLDSYYPYVDAPVECIFALAFDGNKKIEDIVIPTNIDYIYAKAFNNCSALSEITFMSPTKIYHDAFAGCTSLSKVKYDSSKGTLTQYQGWIYSGNDYLRNATWEAI